MYISPTWMLRRVDYYLLAVSHPTSIGVARLEVESVLDCQLPGFLGASQQRDGEPTDSLDTGSRAGEDGLDKRSPQHECMKL